MAGPYIRGQARDDLKAALAQAYNDGSSVRQCQAISGKSYGATHRMLLEAGVTLRARGGERTKAAQEPATS